MKPDFSTIPIAKVHIIFLFTNNYGKKKLKLPLKNNLG